MNVERTIAIMQPYLFPYFGYFQLAAKAHVFVFYDDVSFINRGWINRNRVQIDGKPHTFTLPVAKASQNKLICELGLFDPQKSKADMWELFRHTYTRAPQFKKVSPWLREAILHPQTRLSRYLGHTLERVFDYLDIKASRSYASDIETPKHLRGEERIVDLVKRLGGSHYINPAGGKELYRSATFEQSGLQLSFLKPNLRPYKQFSSVSMPDLSIVDMLMFLPANEVKDRLKDCELEKGTVCPA